jgi:hypothetical protein
MIISVGKSGVGFSQPEKKREINGRDRNACKMISVKKMGGLLTDQKR